MRTIVTQQELVVAGAEHSHRTTALASLGKLFEARVVALGNSDTLETSGRGMYQQLTLVRARSCLLCEVHDLKALCTQDDNFRLEEDQIKGFRWKEEVL